MPEPGAEPLASTVGIPAAPASTTKVSFAVPVAGAFLHAEAQLPAGRTTLTQLLPVLQNIENAILSRVDQEAREAGTPISCRAGCGACCRQMVPVSLFEAEALTDWFQKLPEARRDELAARFHRGLMTLRDAGVVEKLVNPDWSQDKERATQLAVDYFHAHVACPFLEDESCSIHPIRPLACREYLVTSPPELCRDPSANDVSGVQLPVKLSHVLESFGRELSQDPRGWIPLIFLLAWGKGGARPGDYVTGTGEEVIRYFLDRLAEISAQRKE
jgi:Fe-S-cluster containining protein